MDTFELVRLRVEFRQTVAGAEYDSKELRYAKDEVNQLRNKEEEHRLTEVS